MCHVSDIGSKFQLRFQNQSGQKFSRLSYTSMIVRVHAKYPSPAEHIHAHTHTHTHKKARGGKLPAGDLIVMVGLDVKVSCVERHSALAMASLFSMLSEARPGTVYPLFCAYANGSLLCTCMLLYNVDVLFFC